jgi:uncharacterized protein YbbK (DUF523 family)
MNSISCTIVHYLTNSPPQIKQPHLKSDNLFRFRNNIGVAHMKIPVGISSCLLGENVRYDGTHKYDDYINEVLSKYFEFRPFCPEMAIGLGVPRQKIHLVQFESSVRCTRIEDPSTDVTDALIKCANEQASWQSELCGYIFKKGSPSCGIENVKLLIEGDYQKIGQGLFAQQTMKNFPYLPIEEEGRLSNVQLRESFILRVKVLHEWKVLMREGVSIQKLFHFHNEHRLTTRTHTAPHSLEGIIAPATDNNLEEVARQYLLALMKKLASR